MKLVTFQILLISICSISCVTYCAVSQFDPEKIFDVDEAQMGLLKLNYKGFDKSKQSCFVSFHAKSLPKKFEMVQISDCSQHFRGQIKAGVYAGKVPEALEKKRCFWQHDWVFCLCNNNFCNSPQYWPMILSRFELEFGTAQKTKSEIAVAKNFIKTANVHIPKVSDDLVPDGRDNLRCLVWYADTVNQEEYDPPFYLFNYITNLHTAPPLEDALSSEPRVKSKDHFKKPRKLLYTMDPEPFEDGSMTNGDGMLEAQNREDMLYTLEKGQSGHQLSGIIALIVGVIFFVAPLVGTIVFLNKLCARLRDHSQFIRINTVINRNRYERLHRAETVPKEFVRKKTAEKMAKKQPGSPKNASSSDKRTTGNKK